MIKHFIQKAVMESMLTVQVHQLRDSSMPETLETINKSNVMDKSSMWAVFGDSFKPCKKALEKLEPGFYRITIEPNLGLVFNRHEFSTDELLGFDDQSSNSVVQQIKKFWTLEDHFKKYGFVWKRGILLWGPPGSGKTSTINLVAADVIKSNGVVLLVSDIHSAAAGLAAFRQVQPYTPMLCIIEDIDAFGENATLLSLLDGELQINNVVFIATTNYPERLDARIINRPSRFDIVEMIGFPSEKTRDEFFKQKSEILKHNFEKRKQWVNDTKDFSFSYMKELIIAVEVFQCSYESALARLNKMRENNFHSQDNRHIQVGFAPQSAKH